MRNNVSALVGLCVLILCLTPSAHATLLCLPAIAPGGLEFPNVDDSCPSDSKAPDPLGSIVSDTGMESFSLFGSGITTAGSLREIVYRELTGTLDFYIQLEVTSGSSLAAIDNVNTADFSSFLTRIGTLSSVQLLPGPPGTAGPALDTRSALGDTIEWSFLSPVTLNETSFAMAISTNATADAPSNIGLLGAGGGTETLDGLQPVAAVPEPVAIVLLGTALALFAVLVRRRRAVGQR